MADDDDLYKDDASSDVLHSVSVAPVINVTGKAVVAWARVTTMRPVIRTCVLHPLPIAPALYCRS